MRSLCWSIWIVNTLRASAGRAGWFCSGLRAQFQDCIFQDAWPVLRASRRADSFRISGLQNDWHHLRISDLSRRVAGIQTFQDIERPDPPRKRAFLIRLYQRFLLLGFHVNVVILGERAMQMDRRALLAGLMYGGTALAQNTAPPSTSLKVGDKPPDFTLPSTEGGTVHLADFIGKSTVVLAFFPAAFTGG